MRYRPLFSGPAVERVPELQFQRPQAEVELSRADAEQRGIRTGDEVDVSTTAPPLELRAGVSTRLREGIVRVARRTRRRVAGLVTRTGEGAKR